MHKYQVIVGNVGTVYDGDNEAQALREYAECVKLSKESEVGRMSDEDVTLFVDNEPEKEYSPDEKDSEYTEPFTHIHFADWTEDSDGENL